MNHGGRRENATASRAGLERLDLLSQAPWVGRLSPSFWHETGHEGEGCSYR
jgi:hypothetical protein